MMNIYKITFLSLLCATTFYTSKGQVKKSLPKENTTISSGQSKLIKTQFSQEGDNVQCNLQDRKGNLWFTTSSNGVYRYDGKSFKNFTIKDGLLGNNVSSMLQDKKGNIWFGGRGLSRFGGKTFSDIPSTDFYVYSMLEDKSGKLWFSTTKGVY